mgnify:CR=1 FL=1
MLAGSLASVINTVGMGVAMGNPFKTMAAYFIGDIRALRLHVLANVAV